MKLDPTSLRGDGRKDIEAAASVGTLRLEAHPMGAAAIPCEVGLPTFSYFVLLPPLAPYGGFLWGGEMISKKIQYRVEFYAVIPSGRAGSAHKVVRSLFEGAPNGRCSAVKIDPDHDETYQVRSLVKLGGGATFKGVFGRCRIGMTPEQVNAEGDEEDVELKPGYGLAHKNHFMYFAAARHGLFVYQRNAQASHFTRFQRYLRDVVGSDLQLEPILTRDTYQRLLSSTSDPKAIELSLARPSDPSVYPDVWSREMLELMESGGAQRAKIVLTVGRKQTTLKGKLKQTAVNIAKGGAASVVRVKLDGEQEPIDLLADRVIDTISVKRLKNGRADPEDIYVRLAESRDKKRSDIDTFFGS